MPAPYPPPPAVNRIVKKVAKMICEDRGHDPAYLEPGDGYGVDAVLANGDPAHFLWRQHVEVAAQIVACVERHKS